MTIPQDKRDHFIAGLLIAGTAGLFIPPAYALLLGCTAAIGKEVYDAVSGEGTPEIFDALATILGSFIAAGAWSLV